MKCPRQQQVIANARNQQRDADDGIERGVEGRGADAEQLDRRKREENGSRGRIVDAETLMAQACREIRVIVEPSEVDDDGAALLSHEIAREIEDQLEYPGQVKVIVIRESRAIEVAK